MVQPDANRTDKGERTRARIVDAALELFRERGYEATTMRMVAQHAGVSLGNAYYYFESKEHLLQAFYTEIDQAHLAASEQRLAGERDLRRRLLAVMQAKLDVIEPYHRFSALMFRAAADPTSRLNPFHPAGAEFRRQGEQLFARVLEGARIKIPADLARELPGLLWTYNMGIVLYWIFDDTPDRARTRRLVEQTVDLVVRVIKLAQNPLLRPLRRRVLALLDDLRAPVGGGEAD